MQAKKLQGFAKNVGLDFVSANDRGLRSARRQRLFAKGAEKYQAGMANAACFCDYIRQCRNLDNPRPGGRG